MMHLGSELPCQCSACFTHMFDMISPTDQPRPVLLILPVYRASPHQKHSTCWCFQVDCLIADLPLPPPDLPAQKLHCKMNLTFLHVLSLLFHPTEIMETSGEEGVPDLVHVMRNLSTENIPNLPPGGGLASK